jgi:hypothetical protein
MKNSEAWASITGLKMSLLVQSQFSKCYAMTRRSIRWYISL